MCFFFFQAEDGIRDLVRSRGLGDVYKRQDNIAIQSKLVEQAEDRLKGGVGRKIDQGQQRSNPVSYTHLTLPTSDLV